MHKLFTREVNHVLNHIVSTFTYLRSEEFKPLTQ